MKNGYFFCGDIIGFSYLIDNVSPDLLKEKIDAWITKINEFANEHHITQIQLFSDSIFAAVSDNYSDLTNLIAFIKKCLNYSATNFFPIRGAITKGSYHWGKLVYGKAVIEAHQLEKIQNWIGVIINDTFSIDSDVARELDLFHYQVPTTKGSFQSFLAVSWDIPSIQVLKNLFPLTNHRTLKQVIQWKRKIINTIRFGNHLKQAI